MPSDVDHRTRLFDEFAERAATFFSRAPFFACCVLVVVLWAPTYLVFDSVEHWQLLIHTIASVVTFLMVALLQNQETRADAAIQGKLNAIAHALADLMESQAGDDAELRRSIAELRQGVGLEQVESS